MVWYKLNKNGLWKMQGNTNKALELVTHMAAVVKLVPANMAPDILIVEWNAENPIMTDKPEQKAPGTSAPKPKVIQAKSPNYSARGSAIKRVILHYTTAAKVEGTLSWFENPASQVSAHYVVDRNGDIYQCVSDERKAWHAFGENDDSIGIEHVATQGQTLTEAQEQSSANLIRYLKAQYKITNNGVTGHRFTKSNVGRTDCPGDLWETEAELKAWLTKFVPDTTASVPSVKSDAILKRGINQTHIGAWNNLAMLELTVGSKVFHVASGARGAQNFRRPQDPRSTPGNLEPLPQGTYTIGNIAWAKEKDSYEGSHGNGLGPVWIPLTADFSDDRGAFGFHLDSNIGTSAGSAGCVVFRDINQLRDFIAILTSSNTKRLVVDWGL